MREARRRPFLMLALLLLTALLGLASCGDDGDDGEDDAGGEETTGETARETMESDAGGETSTAGGTFSLSSPAFPDGGTIPAKYTADGENVSPPLEWQGVPEGTTSFAVVVRDPDAPTDEPFVHWVIWDVDGSATGIAEGEVPDGATQGTTDFGSVGWAGPSPPPGDPHRYVFTLFALDSALDLAEGASAGEVESAAEAAALGTATLTGLYGRG